MKKNNRILKSFDFTKIIKTGYKAFSKNFSIFFIRNNEISNFKVGISIPKKVSKLAVKRNKIKRQINYILISEISNLENIEFVIIAKPTVIDLDFITIQSEIQFLINHMRRKQDVRSKEK